MYNNENFEENQKPMIVGETGNYEITFVTGKKINVKDIKVYHDFLAIQSTKNDLWKIADKFGNFSETFSEILKFEDGFFVVRDKDNLSNKYRDLIGRTTDNKTESGKAFFQFINGEKDFNDLKTYWLTDVKFLLAVVQEYVKRVVAEYPAEYNTSIKQYVLRQQITKKLQDMVNSHFSTVQLTGNIN